MFHFIISQLRLHGFCRITMCLFFSSVMASSAIDVERELAAHFHKGERLFEGGAQVRSMEHFEKALSLARKAGLKLREAEARMWLGRASPFNHIVQKVHFLLALEAYCELGNSELAAEAYHELGDLYRRKGPDLNKAEHYLLSALEIRRELNQPMALAKTRFALAQTFFQKGDPQLAIEYLDALARGPVENLPLEVLFEMGNFYRTLGKVNEASRHYLLTVDRVRTDLAKFDKEQLEETVELNWAHWTKQTNFKPSDTKVKQWEDEVAEQHEPDPAFDSYFSRLWHEILRDGYHQPVSEKDPASGWELPPQNPEMTALEEPEEPPAVEGVGQPEPKAGNQGSRLFKKPKILEKGGLKSLFKKRPRKNKKQTKQAKNVAKLKGFFKSKKEAEKSLDSLNRQKLKHLDNIQNFTKLFENKSKEVVFYMTKVFPLLVLSLDPAQQQAMTLMPRRIMEAMEPTWDGAQLEATILFGRGMFKLRMAARASGFLAELHKKKRGFYIQEAWDWYWRGGRTSVYISKDDGEIAEKLGLHIPTNDAWIGDLRFGQKAYHEAIKAYGAVSLDGRDAEDDTRISVFAGIARANRHLGKLEAAIANFKWAIDELEAFKESLFEAQLVSSFQDRWIDLYDELISCLADEGEVEAAFEYAERARAQALQKMIGNPGLKAVGGAKTFAEARALKEHVARLEERIAIQRYGEAIFKKNGREQQFLISTVELQRELDQTRVQLARRDSTREEAASNLASLRKHILDEETALIAYYLLGDRVLAWVVDREGVDMVSLPVGKDDVQEYVRRYRQSLIKGAFFDDHASAAGDTLYNLLWKPLPRERFKPKMVVVPHRQLHFLPFAALWSKDEKKFLIEDLALMQLPSAAILGQISGQDRVDDHPRLLAMGNPDVSSYDPSLSNLLNAEYEAADIAKIYDGDFLIGSSARERLVHDTLADYQVLHLATHGILNETSPMDSFMALAADEGAGPGPADGKLRAREVAGMDLSHLELVVLSGCDTALDKRSTGDELVTLNRSFLRAGAGAVISTLWSVDDRATSELMSLFHKYRKEQKMGTAVALRRAQLDLIARHTNKKGTPGTTRSEAFVDVVGEDVLKDDPTSDLRKKQGGPYSPKYWAGFILTGPIR